MLVVKNPSANAGDIEMQVQSLGGEDSLEEPKCSQVKAVFSMLLSSRSTALLSSEAHALYIVF